MVLSYSTGVETNKGTWTVLCLQTCYVAQPGRKIQRNRYWGTENHFLIQDQAFWTKVQSYWDRRGTSCHPLESASDSSLLEPSLSSLIKMYEERWNSNNCVNCCLISDLLWREAKMACVKSKLVLVCWPFARNKSWNSCLKTKSKCPNSSWVQAIASYSRKKKKHYTLNETLLSSTTPFWSVAPWSGLGVLAWESLFHWLPATSCGFWGTSPTSSHKLVPRWSTVWAQAYTKVQPTGQVRVGTIFRWARAETGPDNSGLVMPAPAMAS